MAPGWFRRRRTASGTESARSRPPRGKPFQTAAGPWVRSGPEARIHNFLTNAGMSFAYEPKVAGGLRPDFLIEGRVIVEYWGGAGFRSYANRMAIKTSRYEAHGFKVIHLMPIHLWELEVELARQLRAAGIQSSSTVAEDD